MTKKAHQKQDTVRLTIDFPAEQHTYIKMLATMEGVSLRQFVIERLPSLEKKEKKKHKNINEDKFEKLLDEFVHEKSKMLKRLAKR